MSKELTAEEIAQWVIDHRYKSVFKQITDAEMFTEIVDKITLKLQEQAKEIEELKLKLSGKTFFDEKEAMEKEIERLNGELDNIKIESSHEIADLTKEIERLKRENKCWEDVIQDIAEKHKILIPIEVENYLNEHYVVVNKLTNQ